MVNELMDQKREQDKIYGEILTIVDEAWDEETRGVKSEQIRWRELRVGKLNVEDERIRDTIEQMFELQAQSNPQAAPAAPGQPAAAAMPARTYNPGVNWHACQDLDPGPIQENITKQEWRTMGEKVLQLCCWQHHQQSSNRVPAQASAI